MGKERLKRIAIIICVGGLTFLGATAFIRWQEAKKVAGESIKLPTESVTEKIEELGEQVLGKAVDILPGDEKIKEKEKIVEKETETTKILETQTKEIIEILKRVPEEQLKQIRKQIFKDFCEEVMGE